MKRIYNYLKKDAALTISWVLAIISMLFKNQIKRMPVT